MGYRSVVTHMRRRRKEHLVPYMHPYTAPRGGSSENEKARHAILTVCYVELPLMLK